MGIVDVTPNSFIRDYGQAIDMTRPALAVTAAVTYQWTFITVEAPVRTVRHGQLVRGNNSDSCQYENKLVKELLWPFKH